MSSTNGNGSSPKPHDQFARMGGQEVPPDIQALVKALAITESDAAIANIALQEKRGAMEVAVAKHYLQRIQDTTTKKLPLTDEMCKAQVELARNRRDLNNTQAQLDYLAAEQKVRTIRENEGEQPKQVN